MKIGFNSPSAPVVLPKPPPANPQLKAAVLKAIEASEAKGTQKHLSAPPAVDLSKVPSIELSNDGFGNSKTAFIIDNQVFVRTIQEARGGTMERWMNTQQRPVFGGRGSSQDTVDLLAPPVSASRSAQSAAPAPGVLGNLRLGS